ncbi:MAG: hypothetical protein EXS05_16020 [Planctomycetaceae bacterium]|nr:hypothetical protein [Planctomycetaceae bacterium]
MAENEYLDSTKARRWLAVADGLRDGCNLDELTKLVQERLYKTLRVIGQQIPLAELFAYANDLPKLRSICERVDGATDVTSLLLDAALVPHLGNGVS